MLVGLDGDLPAVEVPPGQVDLLGPHDRKVQARDRQAAFLELPLAAALSDGRVDDGDRIPPLELVDEEPLLHPDLRGGQAQPLGLVHGLHHVVHQVRQPAVDVRDLCGALGQHGIAKEPDLVGSHYFMVPIA